jgi:hypothetical protein
MILLVLLFIVEVFGKENFQVQGINVTTTQALQRCFLANLCTYEDGCCHGHGVCKVNGTQAPECVCGKPQDCRAGLSNPSSYPSYTGSTCATAAIVPGCCNNDNGDDDHLFAASGVCNKRDGTDPESGSKGRLLKRIGGAWYADGLGTSKDSNSSIQNMTDTLLGVNRSIHYTGFNMMALGFLQVGLKDIVHFNYSACSEKNVTFNGTTYPEIRWQNNTGIQAENVSIPKQFENVATAIVDVGPLYDYATRVSGSPYINVAPAVNYWNQTHHMTSEFLLAIKFFGLWHNYVARNVEEYFCGANSLSASTISSLTITTSTMSNVCTISVLRQYELTRRSTIRFVQALLQQAAVQFVLENENDILGLSDPTFDQWFRRDVQQANGYWLDGPYEKSRTHQEFVGDVTRTDLSHHMISGLDFFVSARNPNINTTAFAILGEGTCGFAHADIAADVINHFNTKTQRFGSRIHSKYNAELSLILNRVNELGLNSYKVHVDDGLTDDPTSSDITTHYNVYYGAHTETNAARQYHNTAASVAVAATVALSDAIKADRTNYWAANENGEWTAHLYHPNSEDIQSPGQFDNCYKNGGSECTTVANNAGAILTGQIVASYSSGYDNWRSRGALFAKPLDYCPQGDQDEIGFDHLGRQTPCYQLIPEIINPLFYQFDGLPSMSFKSCDSFTDFLPNFITDAVPTNIGWTSFMDGRCFREELIEASDLFPACSRERTSSMSPECVWFES